MFNKHLLIETELKGTGLRVKLKVFLGKVQGLSYVAVATLISVSSNFITTALAWTSVANNSAGE